MSVFRRVPELDWLKQLAQGAFPMNATAESQLMNLYKYLLWSRRYQLTAPTSPEGKVAHGLLTKYYRRIYTDPPLNDFEKKFVKQAEKAFTAIKHGKVPTWD